MHHSSYFERFLPEHQNFAIWLDTPDRQNLSSPISPITCIPRDFAICLGALHVSPKVIQSRDIILLLPERQNAIALFARGRPRLEVLPAPEGHLTGSIALLA